MNAKEYLLQARYLDERITSKTQQIASLNDLATKCTSTIQICRETQTTVVPEWKMPF